MDFFRELGSGITLIDTGYIRDGLTACYLLEQGGEVALIETGSSAVCLHRVMALLKQKKIKGDAVKYVIPTHVHLDHAGGAGSMMSQFSKALLVVHPRGKRHMVNPDRLVAGTQAVYGGEWFEAHYGDIKPIPEERIFAVDNGATLDVGGRELSFMHTLGHANHHFAIWDEKTRGWFTGDTFGVSYPSLACGQTQIIFPSTTPPQFDPEEMLASIDKLMAKEPQVAYLTHFGPVYDLQDKADQLRRKICIYSEFAHKNRGCDDVAGTIARDLLCHEKAILKELIPHVDEAVAEKWLAWDAKLNAQGLAHWIEGCS